MSIFNAFRQGQPPGPSEDPLSVDDLMGADPMADPMGGAESMELPPEAVELPPLDGPESAMGAAEIAEFRDMLVERAQARQQRSLQYQEEARVANGLPK